MPNLVDLTFERSQAHIPLTSTQNSQVRDGETDLSIVLEER